MQVPGLALPPTEGGLTQLMELTYGQLFNFMATFTNEELANAQTIAEHCSAHLGKTYNQTLVQVLVEMREHQLAN